MKGDEIQRPWRQQVGGLWEKIGKLQFDLLVKEGLRSDHFLLDVGCGSLRGGIFFIKYLVKGHYFGIDKNPELLKGGKIELDENDLLKKNPVLKLMENFEFDILEQNFQYAIAQSVFTHLSEDKIKKCLTNIQRVLTEDGRFYATFFESKPNQLKEPLEHKTIEGKMITYPDKDPFHYPFSMFQKLCSGTSLYVQYIGEWNHPRSQKLMVFIKKSAYQKEKLLEEANISIETLKKTIEQQKEYIQTLEKTIKAIQNSITWRNLTKLDKFRKKFTFSKSK